MKSLMEQINEAPTIEYDPSKGITMEELAETFDKLKDYKPRKPEYILSRYEAENLLMWQLNWLGENYIVLCNLEVSNIIKKRETDAK